MSIRDYAVAALTTVAFTEHTIITLEDDPVQVSNAKIPSYCLPDPSGWPLPICYLHSGLISRLSKTLRRRPLLSSLANGGPDKGPPGLCHNAPDTPTSPRTTSNIANQRFHGRTLSDSRTAIKRIVSTAPRAPAPRSSNPPSVIIDGATHTPLRGAAPQHTILSPPTRAHLSSNITPQTQKIIRSYFGNHTRSQPPPHHLH